MNYFEVFDLPIQLSVDKIRLTRRFHELAGIDSTGLPRDTSSTPSPHDLQISSIVIAAYKTLLNHDETIRYVLQLKGLMHEEEKYEPDPEFLLELNGINQALAELTEAEQDKVEAIELELKELLKKVYAQVEPVIENYDENTVTEKELLQVKEYYYRKKYLQRILDRVMQMRNIAAL
jgi:molecular chaperone HscB